MKLVPWTEINGQVSCSGVFIYGEDKEESIDAVVEEEGKMERKEKKDE